MTEDAGGISILLALQVSEESEHLVRDERVAYCPELDCENPSGLYRALATLRPDVVIARRFPDASAGDAWRRAAPLRPLLAVAVNPEDEPGLHLERLEITIRHFQDKGAAVDGQRALAFAERTWTYMSTCSDLSQKLASTRSSTGRSVVMAGAGIVNLLTALHLLQRGFELDVYDSAPDPRINRAWDDYGCTRGGENARMFTLTEGDDYHDKGFPTSGSSNAAFDRPISEGGWRICSPPSADELKWVEEFKSVPPWLARVYTEDILYFNREGGEGWKRLIEDNGDLFEDVELREGILRLYTDYEHFREQVGRHDQLGAAARVLTAEEISEVHPALAGACKGDEVVGGIEVVGFTLGVHDLVGLILDRLERGGARLHWSSRVENISWSSSKMVEGLVVDGELLNADHYVLSPGAYGFDLLRGTASEGLLHGVLGLWMTLPNRTPQLKRSLKIARRGHPAEDTNVTARQNSDGQPVLVLGSGYGWTGTDPANIDPAQLNVLRAAVDDTARRFFPESYPTARGEEAPGESLRFCIRPWTASNLPLLEIREARGGGSLIVTGGHNTGGFAQAPAVAAAVCAALRGEEHPMHGLYDPRRLRNFKYRSVAQGGCR
jgi:glycine/D-amino acid oxidase-like deaminating enzyme